MNFEKKFFVQQKFNQAELDNRKQSIKRNLGLARGKKEPEIVFHFSYMALIKTGIYHIAKAGYRVKRTPGHHIKIIEALSKILKIKDIMVVGDKMRKDRNIDLYCGGVLIGSREAKEYFDFVENIHLD